MRNILKKIQGQPEKVRKIILWIIIVVLGFAFFLAWVQGLKQRLREAREERFFEQLKPPRFEEQLRSLPKIEIPEFPEISEEELKKLEEEIKKETEQTE